MNTSRRHYLQTILLGLCLGVVLLLCTTAISPEAAIGQTVPPAASLSVTVNGGGQVDINPPGNSFAFGQAVALDATPYPGWDFVRWDSQSTTILPWLDEGRDYRAFVTVSADSAMRTDHPAEVSIDFTALLRELEMNGQFDPTSIHVVELNAFGNVTNTETPFQFDPASGFNPSLNASGTLIIYMSGQTDVQQKRYYHVYFGLTDKTYSTPTFSPLVQLTTTGIDDEGQAAFKIETLNATYYYQKYAGGFSSLVDNDGNDWINHSTAAGGDGAFRGIPNAVAPANGGHLHPGRTSAETTVLHQGPLKVTLRSIVYSSNSQPLWETLWYIYPRYATMMMNKKPNDVNYWFLYEGTPGGEIGVEDTVTRSDGVTTGIATAWNGDLNEDEWVYFADGDIERALFLYKHGADSVVDSYYPYRNNAAFPEIKMTVFGFGRERSSLIPQYSTTPTWFTIGLNEETGYAAVKRAIQGVHTDLASMVDAPEQRFPLVETLPPTTPLTLSMASNRVVSALFTQQKYGLIVSTTGAGIGAVGVQPLQDVYHLGDTVTLTAIPEAGSEFVGWLEGASGNEPTITVTINGNIEVTANFEHAVYKLAVDMAGDGRGSVERLPSQNEHLYGDMVTLTARPAVGSYFDHWSGDVTSQAISTTLTMVGNSAVTSTFGLYRYDLEMETEGDGVIFTDPSESTYTYGEQVTLLAAPAARYVFARWKGDLTGVQPSATLVITDDMQIVAEFIQIHDVNVNVKGQGTVELTPNSVNNHYSHGLALVATATPTQGWRFAGWSGDWSGVENPLDTQIQEDITAVATFELDIKRTFLPLIAR